MTKLFCLVYLHIFIYDFDLLYDENLSNVHKIFIIKYLFEGHTLWHKLWLF